MKQQFLATAILSLTTAVVFSQNIFTGKVIDAASGKNIAYVNIGIATKGLATVSNKNGEFSLTTKSNITTADTLTLSHIGYKTRKIAASKINTDLKIVLEEDNNELAAVDVKFIKPKQRKIGRTGKGLGLMHMNFYSSRDKVFDDRLSRETGMKLTLKKDCRINNLNFNITSNEFKSVKFRLNFYNIKNGLPSEIIVPKDIIFEVGNAFKGWFTVDLKPYEIFLDEDLNDIAVTIQWIESEKLNTASKYFAISTAMSATETSFYRENGMQSWLKSGQGLSFYLDASCK